MRSLASLFKEVTVLKVKFLFPLRGWEAFLFSSLQEIPFLALTHSGVLAFPDFGHLSDKIAHGGVPGTGFSAIVGELGSLCKEICYCKETLTKN